MDDQFFDRARQFTLEEFQIMNGDRNIGTSMLGMEVRYPVVVEI